MASTVATSETGCRAWNPAGAHGDPKSVANPFAERLIGSIRRECLNHIIVLGEQHLRWTLKRYVRYYLDSRSHLSLEKDSPNSRPVQSVGEIVAIPQVGGLH